MADEQPKKNPPFVEAMLKSASENRQPKVNNPLEGVNKQEIETILKDIQKKIQTK
ncbi:hypothetical protein HZB01_00810 [Candidatus Woesearchaeota archaeon]|nr:hypothetical protein [Candidatus Woesearchaeota archaeon]